MKKEIYYVTSNDGKFEEVKSFIEQNQSGILLKQFKADIPEIQTSDQKLIAVLKAKKAWKILQKPLLCDDSAIYFEKYTNFPGTLSKYVSLGIGFEGIKRLIDHGDKAKFLLYMIYVENPNLVKVFKGECKGSLINPEKFSGNPNLPYDCYFIPQGTNKTYVELKNTAQGDKYVYRLKALQKFLNWHKKTLTF